MSQLYSDCFPADLLCFEESGNVTGDSPEISSAFAYCVDNDAVSIAGFIEEERSSSSSVSVSVSDVDSSSRSYSVSWILKVRALYDFQAETTYLAVNYLDRFLNSHILPERGGWQMQLLSVACLSLAAKMEEPLVPSLFDLQVEGTKFMFEPKTVQRMELLVLDVLDWRLRLITPFTFLTFFSNKLDPSGSHTGLLISRSTNILLTNIQEATLMEYTPSSVAAAAVLCAARELPSLCFATPELAQSWCHGLCKEKVKECYKLMQQYEEEHSRRKSKSIKVIPQFRVTTQINRVRSYIDTPSSSSSSSTSSSSFSYNNKRRKLNSSNIIQPWLDDVF